MIQDQAHNLGKIATIKDGAFLVHVRILDIKKEYGHLRYKVEPVAGTGQAWVQNIEIPQSDTINDQEKYHAA